MASEEIGNTATNEELPVIPEPDEGALPQPSEAPNPARLETLGEDVDALKAADAPPTETPDVGPPGTSDLPRNNFGDEIKSIVDSDRELPLSERTTLTPKEQKQIQSAPLSEFREEERHAVPTNYEEFQQAINGLKRADGRPWHPNAVARMRREYNAMGMDNGLEAPAGQEHLEVEARERDTGFYRAEKATLGAMTDLQRMLTQVSIENMREITQLKDALTRNRH